MSELAEIQEQIQDTTAAIARTERMLVDSPELPSLLANMKSLQKRFENLQADFLTVARTLGIDVCTYRLFPDDQKPTARGLANALGDFQSLFSVVYDAIRTGPKRTAHIGDQILKDSSFGFAYSFSGSLGVVLTLPDEVLLLEDIDTAFDKVVQLIFEMAKAENPEDILVFAQKLGPAPVRTLYRWADDHVKAGLGAEIQWRRREEIKLSLLIQRPELQHLAETINKTSDEQYSEFEFTGELVGADVITHTFHMKSDEREIKGRFSDAISPDHAVTVPRPYRARIGKTTRVYYSTDREDESFFLLELKSG